MKLRKDTSDQTSSIKPDKFTPAKWRDFERLFPMYLSGFKGAQHASLEYILRPAIPPDHVHLEQRVQELYDYPLTGRHFTEDNHATYRLLADLLAGTEGMSWIEAFQSSQNGRAAWIALKSHYDGGGQKEKRVPQAEALIASLFYKNESVFPFEKFSTGLLDAYRELFLAERPVPEYDKVKRMLEKVVITHGRIEVVKHQVRQDFRADFQGALDFLSTQFAEMFPDATFEQPGRRRRFVATADSERQSLSQRPRLDKLVTHENGASIIHGVDVTEVGRTFSRGEMSTLGPMGQDYIFQERERLGLSRGNNRGGRGRGGRGRGGGGRGRGGRCRGGGGRGGGGRGRGHYQQYQRNVAAVGTVEISDDASALSSPTTAVTAVTQGTVPGNSNASEGSRGPRNGSRFGAGSYNN